MPHEIDMLVGMEKYFIEEDWERLSVFIPRPDGFRVSEEISHRPASEWRGKQQGKYIVYLLKKKGIDHFTVINKIEKILHSKVSYIGIKDANAITEQLIYTVNKGNIIEKYEEENFSIYFLGFSDTRLEHTGNIFNIELMVNDNEELRKRVNKLLEVKYLPAFIGYQRFGTRRPITHLIGKMIVLRNWKGAIDFLIGHPFEGESEIVKRARNAYMKGDYKEALELFPKKFKDERIALKFLLKNEEPISILKKLQTPLSFFVEAYQSYLFNKYLSKIADPNKIDNNLILQIPDSYEKCDSICSEIFKEEGIVNLSFRIKELKINIRSLIRKAYMKIRDLKINDKKISFTLDRGMYATIVIREIARADPRTFT